MVRTRHQVKDRVTACTLQGVGRLSGFSLSIYNTASAEHDLHPFALLHIPQAAAQRLGLFIKEQQWVCYVDKQLTDMFLLVL